MVQGWNVVGGAMSALYLLAFQACVSSERGAVQKRLSGKGLKRNVLGGGGSELGLEQMRGDSVAVLTARSREA